MAADDRCGKSSLARPARVPGPRQLTEGSCDRPSRQNSRHASADDAAGWEVRGAGWFLCRRPHVQCSLAQTTATATVNSGWGSAKIKTTMLKMRCYLHNVFDEEF